MSNHLTESPTILSAWPALHVDFSLGKEAATKEMEKIRASAPMKDRYHRDHLYAVSRYKVLANVVARGDDNGAGFEAAVSKALTSQIKDSVVNRPAAAPAAAAAKTNAGAEAQIGAIRSKLSSAKYGSAEWRELRIQLNDAYARAYPGDQEG